MKNNSIFALLTTFCFATPCIASAAYPVYNSYQNYNGYTQNTGVQANNNAITYRPIAQSSGVTNPTRYTGALPRVGSNATNAGRQYYQPSTYDRLADSGLYIGLSLGYSTAIGGAMSADYASEENAFFAPGAFQDASFNSAGVMPLQISIGAAINDDFRIDFSYLRYNGIEYNDNVMSSDGAGGYIQTSATGGAITSNATMLNVYYNVDSYTGYLVGGSLKPYIGVGVGIALNTIADYVVYDGTFYSEMDPATTNESGLLTGVSDIYAYHNGGTIENLAYMLEAGVSTEMDGGMKLDFFVRYAGLGEVKNSGSIIVSQTEWLSDGAGGEYEAPYDRVFHYTNWYESGSLSSVDIGVRLRLQF
jgi:hypothetical protein